MGDLVIARDHSFKFISCAQPEKSLNIGIISYVHDNYYSINWLKDIKDHSWSYNTDFTELNCIKVENNSIIRILYGK